MLVRLRRWLSSPFGILVIVLFCSLLLGIIYFVLFLYSPERIGLMHQPEIVIEEAYTFSQLEIERDYLRVKIQDGVLVPGYRLSDTEAIVIVGEGEYTFHVPEPYQEEMGEESISGRFALAQLMIPSKELTRLLERTTRMASVDTEVSQRAREAFEQTKGTTPYKIKNLGVLRRYPPPPEWYFIRFFGGEFGGVDYHEGAEIWFVPHQGAKPLAFSNLDFVGEDETERLHKFLSLPLGVSPYVLMALLYMGLVRVLTADAKTESAWQKFADIKTSRLELGVLVSIIGLYIIRALAIYRIFDLYPILVGRVSGLATDLMLLALVIWFLRRRGFGLDYLGLTRTYLWRGTLTALLLAGFSILLESQRLPTGFTRSDPLFLLERTFHYLILIGFMEELFFRGYFQTTLSRAFGTTAGLYLATWLVGFIHIFQRIFLRGMALEDALISALILLPIFTLPTGYLFLRTRNIYGTSLLHGLTDLLPKVLSF